MSTMAKLDQFVRDLFGDESTPIGDDTAFSSLPGWDSLKHVELVVGIETHFNVDLTAVEIAELKSKAAVRSVLVRRGVYE